MEWAESLLTSDKNHQKFSITLNCSCAFVLEKNKHLITDAFGNKGLELTPVLAKILSIKGVAIAKNNLPKALVSFTSRNILNELKKRIPPNFYEIKKIGEVGIYAEKVTETTKKVLTALSEVMAETPFLCPQHPVYIIIGDATFAFEEAEKWDWNFPLLGGAILGRTILFLKTNVVEDLSYRGKLSSALAHEIFHSRMGDYSLFIPSWLEEGLAEIVAWHFKKNIVHYKLEPTIKNMVKVTEYIQAGIWQYAANPLEDYHLRPLTRFIIRKFLIWLMLEFGDRAVMECIELATLEKPWEWTFEKQVGYSLEECWKNFQKKYVPL